MITVDEVIKEETERIQEEAAQTTDGKVKSKLAGLAGLKKYMTTRNVVIGVVIIGGIWYFYHKSKQGSPAAIVSGVNDLQSTNIQ